MTAKEGPLEVEVGLALGGTLVDAVTIPSSPSHAEFSCV